MNWAAVVGFLLAACMVLLGASLGGPLIVFFDLITMVLALGVTAAVLVMTYGWNTVKTYGFGAFKRWMCPGNARKWSHSECERAVRFATSGGYIGMMVGGTCTLIGCVQMLQAMEDPSAIGPAISVALLSSLYGAAMIFLLFLPMARHYKVQALELGGAVDHGTDLDVPLTNSLLILVLVGLSVGLAFSAMLVAMATWS